MSKKIELLFLKYDFNPKFVAYSVILRLNGSPHFFIVSDDIASFESNYYNHNTLIINH